MDIYFWVSLLRWGLTGLLCFLIVAACFLVPPILRPTVITYPWKFPDSQSYQDRDKRRTVVLAGSFNPPHNGHLAMLEYLSKRYGQVIVVIGVNPAKKYLVSPVQRVELLRHMLDSKKISRNVRVEGKNCFWECYGVL